MASILRRYQRKGVMSKQNQNSTLKKNNTIIQKK